jgi:hypothetical protein
MPGIKPLNDLKENSGETITKNDKNEPELL